jgi:WD40 repeat protein
LYDGSLRLWDLESGTQIGEDWRYEINAGVLSINLSPNGKTVASGHNDGKVRLWDIETKKIIAEWTEYIDSGCALCWNADGNQVVGGYWDGKTRVWDVESGEMVLTSKTGHYWVNAVIYSPGATKSATGGLDVEENHAVKIWDAKTSKLFKALKQDNGVWSLAWTSDREVQPSSYVWPD